MIGVVKSAKDYGRLMPEKITRADGRVMTYWVSPEDRNQGKLKGQKDLFDSESAGKGKEDRGYFDQIDRDTEVYQVKPLLDRIREFDTVLAKRIEAKYKNYPWDRDTKEKDIELDYETAWYLRLIRKNPDAIHDLGKEYHEKTERLVKTLNSRKAAMSKLKRGMAIETIGGDNGVFEGYTARGFPVIKTANGSRPMFFEECVR